eukprot:Em0001g2977a
MRVKRCLKRHLQGYYLKKDPDISEEMIHQAGFMSVSSSTHRTAGISPICSTLYTIQILGPVCPKEIKTFICSGSLSDNETSTTGELRTSLENRQPHDQAAKHNRDLIAHAISLGRAGLFGKACKVLESNGLAPNNDTTWQLLQSKHPSCPPPVAPNVNTIPISVGPGFDILSTLRSLTKGTAAGPSGLRIQHLLDAALIPIATPICATLRDIVNLLASGKAPPMVAKFLAGGTLIALNKLKDRSPPDIRPIAVGESLRRLTGKCICALVKDKASDLFQPLQLGVACSSGSEKIIHGLRKSIEDHWMVEDFVVFKIDMQNAFNLVSRQAVLDECATSFPELLPMGYMVLWLISSIDADDDCIQVLFQAWYLDDRVLIGRRSAVLRALSLIEELGPSQGTHINLAKCELFSHFGNSMFPPAVKFSHHPNLEILAAPIGDYLYCSKFIVGKCADARKLLSSLVDVAAVDPHVALSLLRLCGSYCRLVHLARATPSSLAGSFKLFDEEVRRCFSSCFSIDTTDTAWTQAQLSLGFGGLGLRSLSHHSCAAFIASLSTSGCSNADNVHLQQAIIQFNDQVSTSDAITAEAVSLTPVTQRSLSKKLECHLFNSLLGASSMADRAHLLSVSASHAASWLSVTPSLALGLHLEPNELHASIQGSKAKIAVMVLISNSLV